MSKTLRKTIMRRSKLQNTFIKKRSTANWLNYYLIEYTEFN